MQDGKNARAASAQVQVLLIDIHADATFSGTKLSGDEYYGLGLILTARS